MKNSFFMMLVAISTTLFCMHDDNKTLIEKRSQSRRYTIEKQRIAGDTEIPSQEMPNDSLLIAALKWAVTEYPADEHHLPTIWQWPTLPSWNPHNIALEDEGDNYDTEKIS